MGRIHRLLAAGSAAFLIAAGLLFWSVYKDRADGLSWLNLARCLAAGVCLALSAKGTQLRHRG